MIPYGYRRSIQAALFLVAGLCATSISQSQAAYFEGFDNVSSLISNGDPLKWAWLNQSDNPSSDGGWWQASSTLSERSFNAQAGPDNSYAWAGFASTTGGAGAKISNWFISPTMDFATGDTFSYWSRTSIGSAYPDRLQVRLSRSGTSLDVGSTSSSFGDFSEIVEEINPLETASGYPETWTQYTTTITGAPFTGRIGFRYFITDPAVNGNYIGLDSFNTTASITVPEPSTFAMAGISLALLAVLRKNRRSFVK